MRAELSPTEMQTIVEYRRTAAERPAVMSATTTAVEHRGIALDLHVVRLNPYIEWYYSRLDHTVNQFTDDGILEQQAAIDDGRYVMGYIGRIEKTGMHRYRAAYYYTQAKVHEIILGGMLAAGVGKPDLRRIASGIRFPGKSWTNTVVLESETVIPKSGTTHVKYICTYEGVLPGMASSYEEMLTAFVEAVHSGVARIETLHRVPEFRIEFFCGDPNGISSNTNNVVIAVGSGPFVIDNIPEL